MNCAHIYRCHSNVNIGQTLLNGITTETTVLSVSLYSQISTTLKLDSFFGLFWISYKTLYSRQKTKLNLVIFQVVFTVSSFVCNLMV